MKSLNENQNLFSLKEYGDSCKEHKLDLSEEYSQRKINIRSRAESSTTNNQETISIKKNKSIIYSATTYPISIPLRCSRLFRGWRSISCCSGGSSSLHEIFFHFV